MGCLDRDEQECARVRQFACLEIPTGRPSAKGASNLTVPEQLPAGDGGLQVLVDAYLGIAFKG